MNKNVHQLEIEREKLQSELVGTLQKLQATREILRVRISKSRALTFLRGKLGDLSSKL